MYQLHCRRYEDVYDCGLAMTMAMTIAMVMSIVTGLDQVATHFQNVALRIQPSQEERRLSSCPR